MCIGTWRHFIAVGDLVAIGALRTWPSGPPGRFTSSGSHLPARLLRTRPARRTRDRLLIIEPHPSCPTGSSRMHPMQHLPVAPTCRMRTRLPRRANHKHRYGHPTAVQRGASRSSRTLAVGCDGRGLGDRRSSRSRTEKSCGPGAPTLALSSWSAQRALCGRRGQKSPVPGESTKDTVKTIAQGRPVVRLVPVVTPPAFCLQADHGCGQHPAFPAPSRFSRATF
jgi:hypothetical protein